jgi:hypothetical protein
LLCRTQKKKNSGIALSEIATIVLVNAIVVEIFAAIAGPINVTRISD